MSWFSWLWKSDKFQIFASLIIKAAKVFFGDIAEDLYELATKKVREAESTGKSGAEKYKMAYEGIRDELHQASVPEYLINLMIEAAVLVLSERLVVRRRP